MVFLTGHAGRWPGTETSHMLYALRIRCGPRGLGKLLQLLKLSAVLLLGLGWLPTAGGAEEPSVKVGDAFPNLADFELEGDVPKDLKGKLVIVDFWASWCGPCRGTFPLMEELHRRLGRRGLVIIAVNEDKVRVGMTEFLKMHPVSFTVVRDAKKKLAAKVNMDQMPVSYILDGEGKVVSIQEGERTMANRAAFIKVVEDLLSKQTPPKPSGGKP